MRNSQKIGGLIAITMTAALAACGPSESPDESASTADSTPVAEASLAAAPAAFAPCKTCHAVEPGRNLAGPTLAAIVGRRAGTLAGYTFSPQLTASGIVWDAEKLDQWLAGPVQMVPGTRMVMAVPDKAARAEIVSYLETLK